MIAPTRARSSSGVASFHPGPQWSASSSTNGTPRRAASAFANVVFPDPVLPITETRFTRSDDILRPIP